MLEILITLTAVAMFGLLNFGKWFQSERWAATITPLASIMGSGFLISAPLLAGVVGNAAPLVMAGLLLVAWFLGDAIRYNIQNAEPLETKGEPSDNSPDHRLHRSHGHISRLPINDLERFSHLILAFAYFISVTYYVQLLCKFSLHSLGIDDPTFARILGTVILTGISLVGFGFGLRVIEKVEGYAIDLNLAMISALLMGLVGYNLQLWGTGKWALPEFSSTPSTWDAIRISMGLLVVVQGFETSRFLGAEHSASQRVETMKWAQGLAAIIYLVFLSLMLVVNTPAQSGKNADVTAIITLAGTVSFLLPTMLTVAAVGSQFSAAVADEAGCGGLLSHLVGRWLDSRTAYLAIGAITVLLIWSVDVKQIISLASRAFALFYCLQCLVAALVAWPSGSRFRATWYGGLGVLALVVAGLGKSAE